VGAFRRPFALTWATRRAQHRHPVGIEQFLAQSASTLGALLLLLVALTAFLFLRDRKLARRLVAPIVCLAIFVMIRLSEPSLVDHVPGAAEIVRVVGFAVFAFALVRIIATLIVDGILHRWYHRETSKIIRDVISAALYFIAFVAVIRVIFRIDVTATLATAGALSLVLGLALQDTLGNVFSGLAIQLEHPFATGDWVSFGSTIGKVRDLGWRATTMETRDHDLIVVPNSSVTKLEIHNYSRPVSYTAMHGEVGLPYDCPPSIAKTVIMSALAQVPEVMQTPPPKVRLKSFADSAITYELRYFIDVKQWFEDAPDVASNVSSTLWYALKRAGISIPFPIRTVYMHNVSENEETEGIFQQAERMLGEVDFLRPLDDETRRTLARRMRILHFGVGETIVRQGEAGETFYLVEAGEVAIRLRGRDSVERRVATLGPGKFFGEMSLLSGEPRSATVVAIQDAVLLAIDRDGFRDALLSNPDVATQLASILSSRTFELQAAEASSASSAPVREPGRILGKLKELFKLT
jgi:small-conductance mechanosensitive channel/CRP-like cAMP-binding protein